MRKALAQYYQSNSLAAAGAVTVAAPYTYQPVQGAFGLTANPSAAIAERSIEPSVVWEVQAGSAFSNLGLLQFTLRREIISIDGTEDTYDIDEDVSGDVLAGNGYFEAWSESPLERMSLIVTNRDTSAMTVRVRVTAWGEFQPHAAPAQIGDSGGYGNDRLAQCAQSGVVAPKEAPVVRQSYVGLPLRSLTAIGMTDGIMQGCPVDEAN